MRDAWIYGSKYRAGESVFLNEKQAKYELLSGTIREKGNVPATPKVSKVKEKGNKEDAE